MKMLSFVIPCYNSEKTIECVVNEIIDRVTTLGFHYEIILINDGSKDQTWKKLTALSEGNCNITSVCFSKNFGQAAAILAGLSYVKGEICFCLDDDGQAPLEAIPAYLEKLDEGYDVVFAKYEKVKQSFFRNLTSKMNAFMASVLTEKPKGVDTASFFAMRAYVAKNMILYDQPYPYISGLIFRVTHNATNVVVKHRKRIQGKSGYTFRKLLSLWLNGFTSFSTMPLRFAMTMGTVFAILGFLLALYVIVQKILHPAIAAGYTSIMAFNSLLGGIILLCIGEIGEYIGRTYMCISRKPQYIIRETVSSKTNYIKKEE